MESFVLDQMKGLKARDTASEHFRQSLRNNEEEIQRSLTHAVEMGVVRIQPPALPLTEFPHVTSLSMIGISDTNDSLCAQIRNLNVKDENPYCEASALGYANDSILFFTERVAFPVCYVGGLESLRNSYITNIRSHPNHVYWRHFERDYQKYRDILPPSDANEALRRIESTKLVIKSLVLGNLSYARSQGLFYLPSTERGIQRGHYLAATIHESAHLLSDDTETPKSLPVMQSHHQALDRWNRERLLDKHYQLLRIYKYLLEEVYPDNLQTVILGESIHVINMNHTVVLMLYEAQWNNIKQMTGWTDEQMSAELNTYEALDTFSVTLDYQDAEMQGAFRVMRET